MPPLAAPTGAVATGRICTTHSAGRLARALLPLSGPARSSTEMHSPSTRSNPSLTTRAKSAAGLSTARWA
ncbi:hypothetical protein DIPPA_23225 [Diplonema papillatum]|nr:hypothetical protein DIPPA_23225 [Diplonema papillatum]